MTTQTVQDALDFTTPTNTTTETGTAATARQQNARERLDALAGTRATADLPHSCRCGARWSGTTTSHYGACHLTFTGVSTFDAHRDDRCLTPAEAKLVLVAGRAYDCWGTDTEDGRR